MRKLLVAVSLLVVAVLAGRLFREIPAHAGESELDACREDRTLHSIDSNGDGKVDLGDAVHLLSYLFRHGQEPQVCLAPRGQDACPNPLQIQGYQAVTNRVFIDPKEPGIGQVRFSGEGGMSHFGNMRSVSDDQRVSLATGEFVSATATYEDDNGDRLLTSVTRASAANHPDGHITFEGEYSVVGGTGRFQGAYGTLTFEGWSRPLNAETGEGIGFYTLSGVIRGTEIEADPSWAFADAGEAVVDGASIAYAGEGIATRLGAYHVEANSTSGPHSNVFVGIFDGKIAQVYSYDAVFTTPDGDELRLGAVELVFIDAIEMADGSVVPDFSKTPTGDQYYRVTGGTGEFANARGVAFAKAVFVPTSVSPEGVIENMPKQVGSGYLSLPTGESD